MPSSICLRDPAEQSGISGKCITRSTVSVRQRRAFTQANCTTDDRLKSWHEFYRISFTDWAGDNYGTYTDDDDGDLDPPHYPESLESAIAKYPIRAVRILFDRMGLDYSKFEEQSFEFESRERSLMMGVEKRSPSLVLAGPKTKVKKINSPTGSPTEPFTRSS